MTSKTREMIEEFSKTVSENLTVFIETGKSITGNPIGGQGPAIARIGWKEGNKHCEILAEIYYKEYEKIL